VKKTLSLAVFALPPSRVKNSLLRRLGHPVHPTASIGPSLVVGVQRFEAGPGAIIGLGNVFRGLASVQLGQGATIGQLNWFSAAPTFVGTTELAATLRLDECAAITNRHHVDCSGGVVFERYSIAGGMGSILLTHHVSHASGKLECAPIRIGEYALLNAANRMVAGSVLPARSLSGIGAVVLPGLADEGRLYAGVPARNIKAVEGGELFHRTNARATV
jgi:acetyltransferase-like isoleucine patch superfamily enzyme